MQIEKHAFRVAGGGSGLGAAPAARLVSEGGNVVIAALHDAGDWVARQFGDQGRFVHCDVTDESQVRAAVDLNKSRAR